MFLVGTSADMQRWGGGGGGRRFWTFTCWRPQKVKRERIPPGAEIKPAGFTARRCWKTSAEEERAGPRTGRSYRRLQYCTNYRRARVRLQQPVGFRAVFRRCTAAELHSAIACPRFWGGSSLVRLWEGDSWLAESSDYWVGVGVGWRGVGGSAAGWFGGGRTVCSHCWDSQGKRRARRWRGLQLQLLASTHMQQWRRTQTHHTHFITSAHWPLH